MCYIVLIFDFICLSRHVIHDDRFEGVSCKSKLESLVHSSAGYIYAPVYTRFSRHCCLEILLVIKVVINYFFSHERIKGLIKSHYNLVNIILVVFYLKRGLDLYNQNVNKTCIIQYFMTKDQ